MVTTIPVKLLALGVLLMAMAAFAVACGGDKLEFTVLTPTPIAQPPAASTTASGPGAASVIEPTTEPATAPTLAVIPVPATQVIPPTSAPSAPAESPESGPIKLRLMIMKRAPDDTVTLLEKDGVLTSDDHYGIFFEPEADAWVYVLQRDSTTAITVLFPNPQFSDQTNPVSGGTPVWIPKDVDNWFFLDENIGPESFFVVAAKERDEDLEAIIARPERVELLGGLEVLLGQGGRGLGGVDKIPTKPRVLPDGSTVALEQQLLRSEEDSFVYVLPFKHE